MGNNMFLYCYNNPINMLDPNGKDAIWLQYLDGAGYMGHSGLLIQDEEEIWHYFYWGADEESNFFEMLFGEATHWEEKLGTGEIKSTRNLLALLRKSQHKRAAEGIINWSYIKGDFTNSLDYVRSIENDKYSLLFSNCMQQSAIALLKGKFSDNDDLNKRILLFSVLGLPIPNITYFEWGMSSSLMKMVSRMFPF